MFDFFGGSFIGGLRDRQRDGMTHGMCKLAFSNSFCFYVLLLLCLCFGLMVHILFAGIGLPDSFRQIRGPFGIHGLFIF
jgi:hypothetical protein